MTVAAAEISRLGATYGATIDLQSDGSAIVLVPNVLLPPGWSASTTSVRWVLSPAYPAAQPDCFYADGELRLAGGGMPVNTGLQVLAGVPLLWFSWHLQLWRPGRDDLLTYLRFIERRLADAR